MGERIEFGDGELSAEVIGRGEYGLRRIRLTAKGDVTQAIERLGHVPLPPYISREDQPADRERYQTIFADHPGAVAAPTAGLHFSPAILERLRQRGIEMATSLWMSALAHSSPSTKRRSSSIGFIPSATKFQKPRPPRFVRRATNGRPILAVGTTVVRALEDAAEKCATRHGEKWDPSKSLVEPGPAEAGIFIKPGHTFRVVDQLMTNFHLPQSTLLILVSAFAGRELILRAYRHAVEAQYRFYSYGDCMWIR